MRSRAALALLLVAAVDAAADASAAPVPLRAPAQEAHGGIRRDVAVERVLLDAYVTDGRGDVIPSLSASDFRVTLDGRPANVESVEWIPADRPEVESENAETGEVAGTAVRYPPGRLFVLFFQTGITGARMRGFMRMANAADTLLERFLPTDRVAVVSFDSHLKPRLDFTADREAIRKAIFDALLKDEPETLAPAPFPSLVRGLDAAEARGAASVDRGLELVANALAPIGGAKAILYFGWGFRVDRSPKEDRDYERLVPALERARASVFSLDVSDADWHSLETELIRTSELTGGRYEKTHQFPTGALDRVERGLRGRYVLVLEKPAGASAAPRIDVRLVGRRGEVVTRPFHIG